MTRFSAFQPRIWCVLALLCAALVSGAAAHAHDDEDRTNSTPSVEELLRRLEQAEARIRALEAQLKPPAVLVPSLLPATSAASETMPESNADSVSIPAAATAPAMAESESDRGTSHPGRLQTLVQSCSTPLVQVGGRIHIDATLFPTSSPGIGFFENPSTGEDPQNRLEFRRLQIDFSGDVLDNMFYKLGFEFSDPNEPQVLDAYLGFHNVPFLETVRIGNQLRPLGLQVFGSSDVSVFMEDSLVFGESNVDARRIGVLSLGYTQDESVNWQFGVFEFPNLQNSGLYLSDSFEGSLNARGTGTPWYDQCSDGRNYVHLGVNTSFINANDDAQLQSRPELRTQSRWIDTGEIADSNWGNTTGLECVVNLGSFSFGGEWAGAFVGRTNGSSNLFFHGGYIYVAYFLTGDYQPIDRQLGVLTNVHPIRNFSFANGCPSGWGAWQVAARVSYADLSDEDILGGRETNFTLGVNWWFNPHSRLMFNYVVGNIEDHAPVGGFTRGHFSGLAMRLQIAF